MTSSNGNISRVPVLILASYVTPDMINISPVS